MDGFDDENPFDQDGGGFHSQQASSAAQYNVSAPASPPLDSPGGAGFQGFQDLASPPETTPPRPHVDAKAEFCCFRDQWLHSGEDVEILVVDAQKTQVNATSPYITYVIRAGTAEGRHRYSEFESLRANLMRLYPTLIIPPIPDKQTIGDYAAKQGKAKEDAAMIARRKRMLQTFLTRVARHPILSNEHVFHRFLDGEVSWSEILNSPPLTLIPKNILKAPAHDPTDQKASPAYAALPNPSAAHPLRRPDQRFLDSEAFTDKFASHMGGPMEKVSRRLMRRWMDFSQDHAELGAALNGFSLNETSPLAGAIEKTGQAVDATYLSTTMLLQDLEQKWQEPLHEYTQFAAIIKKLLTYRHQKHVQLEMTQDALDARRESLEDLEKHEREARRLDDALSRGRAPMSDSEPAPAAAGDEAEAEPDEEATRRLSSTVPPHPGPSPVRRRVPGMGLIGALSYTLHGMIDADPEAARRSGISKTRENISQLEDALHLSAQDLKYASSTIQADLDRFQRQKVADLREMCIDMARSHRDWCKKNLEAWEDAKKEIATIPDHPAQPPPATEPEVRPPGMRRDSTATLSGP